MLVLHNQDPAIMTVAGTEPETLQLRQPLREILDKLPTSYKKEAEDSICAARMPNPPPVWFCEVAEHAETAFRVS